MHTHIYTHTRTHTRTRVRVQLMHTLTFTKHIHAYTSKIDLVMLQCAAVCCSVVQRGAAWCSVLQHVAVCCIVLTMGWLRLVGSLKLQASFAEYNLFCKALLRKRPVILRSLVIVATPYVQNADLVFFCMRVCMYVFLCLCLDCRVCECIYTLVSVCMCVYTRVHVCMFACVRVRARVLYIFVRLWKYIYCRFAKS